MICAIKNVLFQEMLCSLRHVTPESMFNMFKNLMMPALGARTGKRRNVAALGALQDNKERDKRTWEEWSWCIVIDAEFT